MKLSIPNAQCLLPLALLCCSAAMASGSWLVDGQAVEVLDVQTSNADPNALYTDGSRSMTSTLLFDDSVASLIHAYTPWDGMYDFFIIDEDNEAVHLCNGSSGFFPTEDLYIFGTTVGANGGGNIDFGEYTLKGGMWGVDAVGPYDSSIITRGFANTTYIPKSAGITTNYTVQAGDVLQIQNGVITAINP